jgi:hypothetical protein
MGMAPRSRQQRVLDSAAGDEALEKTWETSLPRERWDGKSPAGRETGRNGAGGNGSRAAPIVCQPGAQFHMEDKMRTAYAFGLAAFLAAAPAMADVVIGGGDNDAARHEQNAAQSRAAARHDNAEAREHAAVGDYRGAAREQNEAREEWRDSHRQERKADNDDRGGVRLQFGH